MSIMKKEIEKKLRGRPPILKNEKLMEKYINIWVSHFYLKLPFWELQKKYTISEGTVKKAISWVNKNFIKIPSKELLRGAIFSIEERIKKLTNQLEKEYKRKEPSIRNIKELNSEIRADNIELLKLQNLYQEKYSIEMETGGSIKQILEILSKK